MPRRTTVDPTFDEVIWLKCKCGREVCLAHSKVDTQIDLPYLTVS
jgi:hypothetical protein